jgi:hypothetical protein
MHTEEKPIKKAALKWELIGIAFIVLLGGMLHFVFGWSGEWRPLALIAAVNESVWEHLKLGFWPALFYFIVECKYIRKSTNNLFIAKAISIYLIPVTITVLFYLYTAFVEDMLVADLIIFVLAIIIGQLVSYKILTARPLPAWTSRLGLLLLVFLTLAFGTLTYYPPQLPIFRDPISGRYGI